MKYISSILSKNLFCSFVTRPTTIDTHQYPWEKQPRTHATNPFERWRKTHREATSIANATVAVADGLLQQKSLLPDTVVLYLFVVMVLIPSILLVLLVLLIVIIVLRVVVAAVVGCSCWL